MEPVGARPLIVEQRQYIQQRRLPCPGRSHDGDKFARIDLQVDTPEDPGLAGAGLVTSFDIFERDHCSPRWHSIDRREF